ncbi:MAG: GPR endopeptidase [Lachnospiraceae bacterium]|nr:GPR endopeptidase [Lachnospiraceae bacterium]
MTGRSDLIIESEWLEAGKVKTDGVVGDVTTTEGIRVTEEWNKEGNVKVTSVQIRTKEAAGELERPMGTYITLEIPELRQEAEVVREAAEFCLEEQLRLLLEKKDAEHMLVIGLGNREVTADAIGPLTIEDIFVTRHMVDAYKSIRENYRVVSALVPGVMAQTGMETMEIIRAVVREVNPDVVLVVDALAARSAGRLGTTIQLTDTGICPGAGIGNNRRELNKDSIGRTVIAIGVPTVLDAVGIATEDVMEEVRDLFVMPRGIDSSVHYISEILAEGINRTNRRESSE